MAISDLYLEWNIFKKNVNGVVTNKTIITEDPIINEAYGLKNYAKTYLIGLSNKININIPNCNYLIFYLIVCFNAQTKNIYNHLLNLKEIISFLQIF